MATVTTPRATPDDLLRVEGKAELIGGRIVHSPMTGYTPNLVAGNILVSLRPYLRTLGRGVAFTDGIGFLVPELPSGRESFSPDVSFYDGPPPANRMKFVSGPPTFAVEVRSEHDTGPAAERAMTAKRADYFLAGTLVVWDVDPDAEVVRVYRAETPDQPQSYRVGETVDAEPAVPGWQMAVAVADIFAE